MLNRRDFLGVAAMAAAPAAKPNVLLINTDDQRFDTIRALGNSEIQTPHLDGLVRRGFHFTNMYSQGGMVGAMCLPSRTMLMTGKSVFRIPEFKGPKPAGLALMPTTFEQAGYRTYHVGKRGNTYQPASEAFQEWVYSEKLGSDRAVQSQLHADWILERLDKCPSGTPFFAYVAPPVPHDPRVAPKEFMDMYDPAKITLPKNFMPEHPFDNGDLKIRDEMLAAFPRTPDEMRRHIAEYYACITCLDHHVGRIFAGLEKSGRMRNTIVMFTSDQGLAVGGRHGLMGKQNMYEHFKAPLIVAGPGVPRGRSEALAYVFDLFPTLCGLAGAGVPEGVEGTSLAPVVQGREKKVRDCLFAVYKDIQRMARDERWKLIWYPKVSRFQLFDLSKDPWELNDLSSQPAHAATLAALKKRMAEQQEKFDDRAAPRPI